MSQQDDEPLPNQLTQVLLREDSRADLPPRRQPEMLTPAPAVVAAASAYAAPFASHPVVSPGAVPTQARVVPAMVASPSQNQAAATAQPPQQQQVRQVAVTARWQNKNESPAQSAIWNCVYYNVHTYQQSILTEMGTLIAAANTQANPGGTISPQQIVDHLKSAVKRMNVRLIELRSGNNTKIEYNTTIMSKLITTQNKIITDELELRLGISLASLAPYLDLDKELQKRSDDAYLAVKNRVDRAKKTEAQKAALKAAAANGGGGNNGNSPAVAAAAAAVAAASMPRPTMPNGVPAAVTAPASVVPAAAMPVKMEDVKPVVVTMPMAPTVAANHRVVQQAHLAAQQQAAAAAATATAPLVAAPTPATRLPAPAAVAGSLSAPYVIGASPDPAPVPTAAAPAASAVTSAAAAAPGVVQHTPTPVYGVQAPDAVPPYTTSVAAQAPPTQAPAASAPQTAPQPHPASAKPKVYNDVDPKTGLQKLPSDKLDSAKKQVEHINSAEVVREEEARLRYAPEATAATAAVSDRPQSNRWFFTNVVDHRHAWCCLRDAGERAGMRRVLKERPWGNPGEPLQGGKDAVESDVLKLMSFSAQNYLKTMLNELKVIAWQRKGGLSRDLLAGVESRLRDPSVTSPKTELRRSLVPRLPAEEDVPRVALERQEEAHRRECEEREARWDSELAETLTTAEEVRKRLIRRGTKKLPPGSFKWWEDMETRAKSGWLSKEQLAASEFARRVAIKHGIGVVAALMKKKELARESLVPHLEATGAAGDPMDVSDRPSTGDVKCGVGGGGGGNGSSGANPPSNSRSERAAGGGGMKRPLDPLADDNDALETVRNIRRRLVLGSPGNGDGDDGEGDGSVGASSGEGGGGEVAGATTEKRPRLEIDNADLAELLRSTKRKGDPRRLASVLFRALNNRKGVHAAGGGGGGGREEAGGK